MIDQETLFNAVLIDHAQREARLNRNHKVAVRPARSSVCASLAAMLIALARYVSDRPVDGAVPAHSKVATEA